MKTINNGQKYKLTTRAKCLKINQKKNKSEEIFFDFFFSSKPKRINRNKFCLNKTRFFKIKCL